MRFLRDIPLQRKLTLITMIATCVALFVAGVAFAVYDQTVGRRQLVRAVSTTAQIIAFNSASALSFSDPSSAEQTLQSLQAQPELRAACIYDRDGAVFARYLRPGAPVVTMPDRAGDERTVFSPEGLQLMRRIDFAGEHVGWLYLHSELHELQSRLVRSALIFAVVLLGAGLIAFGIVSWLQRVISEPVARLAEVAGKVAKENNYSVRVEPHGADEVGALIEGFNAMLAQIQSRDAALQTAHAELEHRVEDRTRALANSISLLNATLDAATDGILVLDLEGEVVCLNSRLTRLWRMSPELVALRDGREFVRFIATQTRDPESVMRLFTGVLAQPDGFCCDPIELIDGQTFECYVHPQRIEGRHVGVVVSFRDVTEQRQAQQQIAREKARLQFIFESVPVGISLHLSRPSGEVTRLINDAHIRICGLTAEQLKEPRIFAKISHPEDYARQLQLQERLNARELDRYSIEKRYLHENGKVVWVSFSAQRHHFPDGSYEELCTVVDITPLKQAQEDIAREQARFKFIFDFAPVGICLQHRHTDGATAGLLNDAYLRICGVDRSDSSVETFQRITHPDDRAQQDVLHQQLDQGMVGRFSLEKRYLKPDGQVVWVVYSVQRQHFADGSHQDLSTIVDITELKRAQEEVAVERARFKFIFESVPVGISLTMPGNDDGHVVNPAHARITGLSAADLLAPGAFERATHPDDWVQQRPLVQRYKRGDIDRFTIEKRYLHADGRVVWVSLSRRMFTDAATGRQHSITTLVDITDLKAAQENVLRQQARFKFIFDAVPVGFTWMVRDRIETRIVNPAHARITGVPVEDSRELERYWDATHPDDRERQRALHDRLLAGEIDHYEIEKRYVHPDGVVTWCAVTIRFYRDAASGETQEITTVVDITERKQAEARLAETHRQLLETSRQAGMAEVATGVLHNVGNVLNSVNVSTTLLSDLVRQSKIDKLAKLGELLAQQSDLGTFFTCDPRGQKVPGFVQTLSTHLGREQADLLKEVESLRKNVEHIKDIVAMQQNYARVSGVSELVAVTDLVEDALRMNAGAFARHDITIVREFEARPRVMVEKHKVLQILVNLLRNAKYACDDSGRTDKRMAIRVWTEQARVKIAVSDNGVGIPAENLTRIFSHGFTTRKHGHGFGLHSGAIAAKELRGALVAQSDGPGCGATFTLELPLNTDAKAA